MDKELADAKESIEREEANTKALLSSIGEGMIAVDAQGVIVRVNHAAEEMLEWQSAEMLGKKIHELMVVEDEVGNSISQEKNALARAIATGERVTEEYYYVRKDGTKFPAAVTASPILLDHKQKIFGAISVFRDIAKEKEVERAKNEFVALVSHQLRTPLIAIQWLTERFSKKEELTEEGKSYLTDIRNESRRLAAIVDSLLNVYRIEEGKMGIVVESFELISFLKEYLDECRPICVQKNITLLFEKHPSTLSIRTDPNALRNIVHSIVSNALEYTDQGGTVEVSVEEKKDTFLIQVSDTGIGIPKKDLARIFQKFIRASNANLMKTDGTGLGLYIARQAIHLLGGTMRFESQEKKGTTFYIELPTASAPRKGEKHFA